MSLKKFNVGIKPKQRGFIMRIICNTNALTDACLNVGRCIPNKAVMPHLEGILISTISENKIELCGYDLELGITTQINVKVERGGSIVVNAKMFCDMLRKIPNDTLVIDCDEKNKVTISSGDTEYSLISLNPTEYPEIPEVTDSIPFNISQVVLREAVKRTVFAVSTDDTKAAHRGIKFTLSPGEMKLVALDGFRLAIRSEFANYEGDTKEFVVPAKTMNEVIKLIDDEDGFVKMSIASKHIVFEIKGYNIISRLLEGEFLDYRTAIPATITTEVKINLKNLIDTIERTSVVITEKQRSPIRMMINEDGVIKVSSITALGTSEDKTEAFVTGKRLEIGFNSRYILDSLRNIEDEEAVMCFNGPFAPMVIKPTDYSDKYMYLVLPVRIRND